MPKPLSHTWTEKLKPLQTWLGIILIAGAPFTFAPSLSLPFEGLVSFRLGLYQLLLVVFVIVMIPVVWQKRHELLRDRWLLVPLIILGTLVVVSPLRSLNMARSALFSASILLLMMTLVSGLAYAKQHFDPRVQRISVKAVLLVAAGVGVFCLLQFYTNTIGDNALGICNNCGSAVFGFPRISGFAAEPQFLASAFLLPTMLAFGLVMKSKKLWLSLGIFGFFLFILGISLSRGGLAAVLAGIIAFTIYLLVKKQLAWQRLGLAFLALSVAGLLSIGALVWSATQTRPSVANISSQTFATIIEHMSAGAIELPYNNPNPIDQPAIDSTTLRTGVDLTTPDPPTSGEIAASQDDRESAVAVGLSYWRDSVAHVLAGLGAGNLGSYAHNQNPDLPLSFTIYMQYIFMLVELGIIGLLAFLTICWLALKRAYELAPKTSFEPVLGSLLVAYLVHYLFFGTYINVPYVWLIFGIALGCRQVAKNRNS